jgi:NADPH:quinone reductase-like Zn-dependent oxidoreductase
MSPILKSLLFGWSAGKGRKMGMLAVTPNEGVAELLELLRAGTLRTAIHGEYPLSDAPEALCDMARGVVLGKVVIHVSS